MSNLGNQARGQQRERRRRSLVWVAGAVLLFFAVGRAPASLLLGLVQNQVPGLQVEAVTGSVWRGRASGLSLRIHNREIEFDNLSCVGRIARTRPACPG